MSQPEVGRPSHGEFPSTRRFDDLGPDPDELRRLDAEAGRRFSLLGSSRWLGDELDRYYGFSPDEEGRRGFDGAIECLEEATRSFETGRVGPGALLYLEIQCRRGEVLLGRSCFRALPHPGALLGVGVANCVVGDEMVVIHHLNGRCVLRHGRWPFSMETSEMLVRPQVAEVAA